MGGVGLGGGVRVDVNEIEGFVKIQKKKIFSKKKKKILGGGWGWGGRVGGQSGCEQRIEVFVKIPQKKFFFFWGGGGGRLGGGGVGEGSGWM